MLDSVLADLDSQSLQEPFATVSHEMMIQQLEPLDKALAAARNDAKETCEAIQSVSAGENIHTTLSAILIHKHG